MYIWNFNHNLRGICTFYIIFMIKFIANDKRIWYEFELFLLLYAFFFFSPQPSPLGWWDNDVPQPQHHMLTPKNSRERGERGVSEKEKKGTSFYPTFWSFIPVGFAVKPTGIHLIFIHDEILWDKVLILMLLSWFSVWLLCCTGGWNRTWI